MALRLKYAGVEADPLVDRDLESSLDSAVADRDGGRPLFALPTYTAMLELRDVLARRGAGPEVVGVSSLTSDGLWSPGTTPSAAPTRPTCRCGASWPTRRGGPVLDVGCGTGRVALDLAAARARRHGRRLRGRRWSARCASRGGRPAGAGARSPPTPARWTSAAASRWRSPRCRWSSCMGGPRGARRAARRRCARHLEPGRPLRAWRSPTRSRSCPPEDALLPLPDVRERDGWVLSSHADRGARGGARRGDRPRPPGGLARTAS